MQNLGMQFFVEIVIPLGKGNRHLPKKLQLQILHPNKIRELQKNSKSVNFAFLIWNLYLVPCIRFDRKNVKANNGAGRRTTDAHQKALTEGGQRRVTHIN